MAGGSGVGWLSVNSSTGELAGTTEFYFNFADPNLEKGFLPTAQYLATASDYIGNTYTAEVAVLTTPMVSGDDGEDRLFSTIT